MSMFLVCGLSNQFKFRLWLVSLTICPLSGEIHSPPRGALSLIKTERTFLKVRVKAFHLLTSTASASTCCPRSRNSRKLRSRTSSTE